jgi:hypothetical protein
MLVQLMNPDALRRMPKLSRIGELQGLVLQSLDFESHLATDGPSCGR